MSFLAEWGAKSLFVSGVSLEDIRSCGRRGPIAFREYLRFDDLQYRRLSDLMVNSAGLTDRLRLAAGKTQQIRFVSEPIYMGPNSPCRTGGGGGVNR